MPAGVFDNLLNLYAQSSQSGVVGSGSFPTMGTSNSTWTLSALTIRTAEHLIGQLQADLRPAEEDV
jgi:hypothetical protein